MTTDDVTRFEFPAITIFESSGSWTAISGLEVVVSGSFGLFGEHLRGPLIVRSRKTFDEKSANFFSVILQEVRPQSRQLPAESTSFRTKLTDEMFSTSKLYFRAPSNL